MFVYTRNPVGSLPSILSEYPAADPMSGYCMADVTVIDTIMKLSSKLPALNVILHGIMRRGSQQWSNTLAIEPIRRRWKACKRWSTYGQVMTKVFKLDGCLAKHMHSDGFAGRTMLNDVKASALEYPTQPLNGSSHA